MKLSYEDKKVIKELFVSDPIGWNISALAREFKVSRATIQFTIYPERYKRNYELKKEKRDAEYIQRGQLKVIPPAEVVKNDRGAKENGSN